MKETGPGLEIMDRIERLLTAYRTGHIVPTREPKSGDIVIGIAGHDLRCLWSVYTHLTNNLGAIAKTMLSMQCEVRAAVPNTVRNDEQFEAWLAAHPEMKEKVETVETTRRTNRPDEETLKVVNLMVQAEVALHFPEIRQRKDGKVPRINNDWSITLSEPEPEEHRRSGSPMGIVVIGGIANLSDRTEAHSTH